MKINIKDNSNETLYKADASIILIYSEKNDVILNPFFKDENGNTEADVKFLLKIFHENLIWGTSIIDDPEINIILRDLIEEFESKTAGHIIKNISTEIN